MSSVGCPRCEESFRVPDAPLPEGLRLRCPWCTEIFKLGELSPRLLPMVELIGEDDLPIDLSQILIPAMAQGVASTHSGDAASWGTPGAAITSESSERRPLYESSERLPLYEPMSRIEPSKLDEEMPGFEDDDVEVGFDTESVASLDKTVVMNPSDAPVEIEVEEFSEFESDDTNEPFSAGEPLFDTEGDSTDDPEFNSDQFDPVIESTEENVDPYQTIVEEGDRLPVTGPVAPRPLGTSAGADFSGGGLNAKPRKKKQSSPILQMAGVVLGGVASVPLAAGVLYMLGVSPDFGFWPFDGTLVKKPDISVSQPMELRDDRLPRPPQNGRSLADDLNPQATNAVSGESSASDDLSSDDLAASAELENTSGKLKPLEDLADLATPTPSAADSTSDSALTMPEAVVPTNNVADQAESPIEPTVAPERTAAKEPSLTMPADIGETTTPMKPDTVEPSFDDIVSNGLNSEAAAPEPKTTPKPPVEMPEPASPSVAPEIANANPANANPANANPANANPANANPANANPKPPVPAAETAPQEPAKASPELISAIDRSDAALKAVLDFADETDVKGLKRNKAMLYETLANLATFPSDPSNREPLELVERVVDAGLMKDLTTAAPNWLRYAKRPNNGLFAVGKAVQSEAGWVLKWNGAADLQLKDVATAGIKSGDDVVIIGNIVDSTPPATVSVTFIYPTPAN